MLMLVLIGTVIILWVWSRRNRSKEEPPVCSGSKILIGNTLLYACNTVQLWNNVKTVNKEAVERGGVLKTTIGPRVIYVVSDPEDVTTVANACLQKPAVYEFAKRWIGSGLVTSSGSQWKVHRKLLNPSFNQCVLESFIDIFNNHSRYLVEKLQVEVGKGPFDHTPYTQSCALNIICSTALGEDFREKNVVNIEFVKTISKMFKLIHIRFKSILLHSDFLFSLSSVKRKQEECIKILHTFSNTILRQRKKFLLEEKDKGPKIKLFMDLLLELARDTNSFTDQEVREHVDTIIIAGHDTSATVLMYCILLVGSYPQVQEKIHDELKNVFGNEDRDIKKQDLLQLVYLEAVIKESMRFYPIVPVIGRHLHKDIKLRCQLATRSLGENISQIYCQQYSLRGFVIRLVNSDLKKQSIKIASLDFVQKAYMEAPVTDNDLPIGGYSNCTLLKGNSVCLLLYGVNRDSMWGPDVEEFRPERWLDPSTLPDRAYTSASFSIGRRSCIGKTYAMMSLKIIMAHFCRNYMVHGDHTKLTLKVDVMLRPVSGHHITIEKRN